MVSRTKHRLVPAFLPLKKMFKAIGEGAVHKLFNSKAAH